MDGLPIALGNALRKIRKALDRNDLVPIVGPALASPPLAGTWEVVQEIGAAAYDELKRDVRAALERNGLLAAIEAIETKGRGLIADAVQRRYANPRMARPDVFSA